MLDGRALDEAASGIGRRAGPWSAGRPSTALDSRPLTLCHRPARPASRHTLRPFLVIPLAEQDGIRVYIERYRYQHTISCSAPDPDTAPQLILHTRARQNIPNYGPKTRRESAKHRRKRKQTRCSTHIPPHLKNDTTCPKTELLPPPDQRGRASAHHGTHVLSSRLPTHMISQFPSPCRGEGA